MPESRWKRLCREAVFEVCYHVSLFFVVQRRCHPILHGDRRCRVHGAHFRDVGAFLLLLLGLDRERLFFFISGGKLWKKSAWRWEMGESIMDRAWRHADLVAMWRDVCSSCPRKRRTRLCANYIMYFAMENASFWAGLGVAKLLLPIKSTQKQFLRHAYFYKCVYFRILYSFLSEVVALVNR